MQQEFYVLTLNPQVGEIFRYIQQRGFEYEVHLNRTRFWVPEGPLLTEFLLRYADSCPRLDPSLDLATGLAK